MCSRWDQLVNLSMCVSVVLFWVGMSLAYACGFRYHLLFIGSLVFIMLSWCPLVLLWCCLVFLGVTLTKSSACQWAWLICFTIDTSQCSCLKISLLSCEPFFVFRRVFVWAAGEHGLRRLAFPFVYVCVCSSALLLVCLLLFESVCMCVYVFVCSFFGLCIS